MKKLAFLLLLIGTAHAQVSSPPAPYSRVAGVFVAYQYGLWSVPVYQISPATGSQTFTVFTSTVNLGDGRVIVPFSTNAPIRVGTEVVTPTAINNCVLNDNRRGVCQITATFTQNHTNADVITSGTHGLQESLNDAGTAGGGSITVDSAWAKSGGTTAMVNAAVLPSGVTIQDCRSGCPSGGSGTVNPGASGLPIPFYPSTSAAVSPSNVTVDATGNNINVPGAANITNALNGPSVHNVDLNGQVIQWNGMLNNGLSYLPSGATQSFAQNIDVIGDSILCCIGPTNIANSPISQLRKILSWNAIYAGTGIIPVGNNNGLSLRPEWTSSGTLTTVNDLGPFQTGTGAFGSTFVLASTATLTLANQPGDTYTFYGETTTDNTGCAISVDGGAATNVATSTTGTPTAFSQTVTMNAGVHTLVVSAVSSGKCYIYGISMNQLGSGNNGGIVINNFAHGYARSEAWGSTVATQLAYMDKAPTPSLVIIGLGVNDAINGTGVTLAQYTTNMTNIINHILARYANTSILIVDENNVSATPTLLTQAMIRGEERTLATQFGAKYVSIAETWGPYATANAESLMAGDGTHPNDSGGPSMASILSQALIGQGVSSAQTGVVGPFKVYSPYPASPAFYNQFNANNQPSPPPTNLWGGACFYVTGNFANCIDLGKDTANNNNYGPRLLTHQSGEVMLMGTYNSASGLPTTQSAITEQWWINPVSATGGPNMSGKGGIFATFFSGAQAGTMPTANFAAGSGAGSTAPTINTVGGNNTQGFVEFTTGTGTFAAGTLFTMTFTNSGWPFRAPVCQWSIYGGTAPIQLGLWSTTQTTATVTTGTALTASTQYQLNWYCSI